MCPSTDDNMTEVLAEEIIGKVAMSNGGHRFGVIEDIVI